MIEVADSSLKYDLETKTLACAKAGISEYWVLDVLDRKLHVFQQPSELGYQSQTILAETLDIAPLFPDCVVAVRALLPPMAPPAKE